MRLVQLTDLHIRPPGSPAYGVADTNALVARALDAVMRLDPPADAIVITGDLTDCGLDAEYRALARLLQGHSGPKDMAIAKHAVQTAPPVLAIPGNHDRREACIASLPHVLAGEDGFVQYAVDLAAIRLVMLDTVVPGAGHGELCDARLGWLDRTLSAAPDRPTWLAMHHPPIATGIPVMDRIALRDPERLAALLHRHRQVSGIICGHVHRTVIGAIAGVPVMIAPSVSYATEFALDGPPRDTLVMEPPQFMVHGFAADGRSTSHAVFVDAYPGPYPCVGDKDYPGRPATEINLPR